MSRSLRRRCISLRCLVTTVKKGVVNCLAVFQRNHAEVFSRFFDVPPHLESPILLPDPLDRAATNALTPLAINLRPLSHSHFEILRRLHAPRLPRNALDTFLATIPPVTTTQPVGL